MNLGLLTQLEWLNLSANRLTRLPDQIGRLTGLRELDLSENQLKKLPRSMEQLTALKLLNLTENPIGLPSEILEKIYRPHVVLGALMGDRPEGTSPPDPGRSLPSNPRALTIKP